MAAARDDQGAYVYGVASAGVSTDGWSNGVEDQPVELVTRGDLAAIVSAAPPGEIRGNRRNMMAHTRVLQDAVREGCVLPMRFGVVMPSHEAVRGELLDVHGEQLLAQLAEFEKLVELDVKVLCAEEALLQEVVAESPEIQRRRERLEGRSPEATYYERIELGELVAGAVAAKRERIAGLVLERLGRVAERAETGEPLHDMMVANVAFLVERPRVPDMDDAVGALEKELGPDCSVRYVGPLPPYNFAGLDSSAEAGAWA